MNFSLLANLQLNKEQITLSRTQQTLLLEIVGRLLHANYSPKRGSILIVRAWADGTYERILSGNLIEGKASGCHTQKLKQCRGMGELVVNATHSDSATFVEREVLEALNCANPGSFYYSKISPERGTIYSEYGHYVLSLPLDNGRLIASFRAHYCWGGRIRLSVSEPWQHELMLAGLTEALHLLMSHDVRLTDSFEEALLGRELNCGRTNSELIQRCLSSGQPTVYIYTNTSHSKLPLGQQAYA